MKPSNETSKESMTKQDLKQLLARMLPDEVVLYKPQSCKLMALCWHNKQGESSTPIEVKDTELLSLCRMVWETLDRKQRIDYSQHLRTIVVNAGSHTASFNEDIIACCENASWEQRTEALWEGKEVDMKRNYDKYLSYIAKSGTKSTGPFGTISCLIKNFDEDFEPLGKQVRADLCRLDLAFEVEDRIFIY